VNPTNSSAQTTAPGIESRPIRLLVVEDSELDFELLIRTLRRDGLPHDAERVEDADGLLAALAAGGHDAVISDHHLPRFSSTEALKIVRSSGLDRPFIIASGTIGEEAAVAAMQSGADDYLIKGRLARLTPALRNAIAAAAARRERDAAQRALAESEQRLRALTDHLHQAVEAERAAIAREVHDDVGGMLTALRFDLSWLERNGEPPVRARARQGLETLNQAVLADAQARRARVCLVLESDVLSLEVSDDCVCIRAADIDKPGSFGLRGLTERARQAHGWLEVAVVEGPVAVRAPHAAAHGPGGCPSRRGTRHMIRVVIVDDHALIRRGIRESLTEAGDISVVGETGDYGGLRQLLREIEFEVLLLDINLPGSSGPCALHALAEDALRVRALVLTMHPEEQ
jgi:DNA-binding NarL/FixJ family response regulator